MKIFAIIPAGGRGSRSGQSTPKQYVKFNNKELIAYTLEIFQRNKLINNIIVAADTRYFSLLERIKKRYGLNKISKIVEGGKERQHSVFNAVASLYASKNDLVVVHDAARPLLPDQVLSKAIRHAKGKGNALVCIKAKDTLVRGDDYVKTYIDRDKVYQVQTPQIFRYGDLIEAMQFANKRKFISTDESFLVKKYGKKVHIVEGSPINFKITSKADIELFRMIAGKTT